VGRYFCQGVNLKCGIGKSAILIGKSGNLAI
jgi:hypothetical protein